MIPRPGEEDAAEGRKAGAIMEKERFCEIPGYGAWERVAFLEKGWSTDRKFAIVTNKGKKLLLRLAPADEIGRKRAEFEAMKRAFSLGVPMSEPLSVGLYSEGAYTLLSWVEGEDAEQVLPTRSKPEQYRLGLRAGALLRTLHSLPAPEGQEMWDARFNRKIDRKIEGYLNCPLRIGGGEAILRYIEEARPLLSGRPQSFQHGDYHAGNLIVSPEGELGAIDFNRFDYGDPWEEFNRIVWCASVSPFFATGRIDGYFGGPPPEAFFPLLALYIASNTLSSIYWAIPFGEKEVATMLGQAGDVLNWFDGMKNPVPIWYGKP